MWCASDHWAQMPIDTMTSVFKNLNTINKNNKRDRMEMVD